MDWKQKLQSAQQLRSRVGAGVPSNMNECIRQQWPTVQKVFTERVGPAALNAAKDDGKMSALFRTVHEALPLPLRLILPQDVFVTYCLSNRDRLLNQEEPAPQLLTKGANPNEP